MPIPDKFTKITKHATPRYMIYQPGFNNSNSCWLEGAWKYIPYEKWIKINKSHQRMYKNIKKEIEKQNHSDKRTKLKDMTPAQKQAWEFLSGSDTLDCYKGRSTKTVYCVRVDFSGKALSENSVKWMEREGYKVIRFIENFGKIKDQTRGIKIPPELIAENEKPIDIVGAHIKQNTKAIDQNTEACFSDEGIKDDFFLQLGFTGIVKLEAEIIQTEWNESIGKPDQYENVKDSIERYKKLRQLAQSKLDGDKFQSFYQNARESHNSCARTNLDNSEGLLYCYVLPVFNEDGTHEPWKEKDVPWGHDKRTNSIQEEQHETSLDTKS